MLLFCMQQRKVKDPKSAICGSIKYNCYIYIYEVEVWWRKYERRVDV